MIKYICGLVFGFFFMLVAWYGLFQVQLGYPTPKSYQVHSALSFKYAQAEKAKSPRIIIVGGSNTLNSISAKQMEEALGVPVYNFGDNSSLGLHYILYDAKKHLRPKDTIILSLEYGHYSFDNQITPLRVDYPVAYDIPFFNNYTIHEKMKRIYSMSFFRLVEGLKGIIFPIKKESMGFSLPIMNNNGDLTTNKKSSVTNQTTQEFASSPPYDFKLNRNAASWTVLKEFFTWCDKRKIKVFIAYPPFLFNSEYEGEKAKVFFRRIKEFTKKNGIETIGDPYKMMYPPKDFFDSVYHLHNIARIVHTNKIISGLSGWIH